MDWKSDLKTNLWIFPRGMARNGEVGPNSLAWTSKYGSVIASAYDCTTDGLNEAGLVANVLWLAESEYPKFNPSRRGLTIAAWAQYVLDNFATVEEAVADLEREPFIIVTDDVSQDEKRLASLHLAISDASGDSAIVEYIRGKQVIHHNRKYQVMTNSPIFDKQLALNAYWEQIGGTVFLPGTNRSSDRFARAEFYVNAIPKDENRNHALASVFSVIRNVSVPYGITTPSSRRCGTRAPASSAT